MPRSQDLPALTRKIAATLAIKPEIFITHPAELRILKAMTEEELLQFAEENGWRAVCRIGGHQFEFYKDAGA